MSNWYDLEVSLREHYKDLLREADERAWARVVPGQHRQPKSPLQALSRQVSWAITWVAQAQKSPRLT